MEKFAGRAFQRTKEEAAVAGGFVSMREPIVT
jgi:hypothetical protein